MRLVWGRGESSPTFSAVGSRASHSGNLSLNALSLRTSRKLLTAIQVRTEGSQRGPLGDTLAGTAAEARRAWSWSHSARRSRPVPTVVFT